MTERSRQHSSSGAAVGAIALALLVWLGGGRSEAHAAVQSGTGAEIYASKCASCHQAFGQGVPGTFPPLAANERVEDPDYVELVIRNGLTGTIEVDGVSYSTAMPPVLGLSDADIDAVVGHVVELAGRSTAPPPATTVAPSEPPNVSSGKKLFIGASRFENGGAACSSCHAAGSVGTLGGPGLGPDLTGSHAKLGGDVGLRAWLSSPPSQTMIPLFEGKPLTDEELGHVVAFLADAPAQDRQSGTDRLLIAGLAGVVVLIAGMAVFWRGMRQTYVSTLRSRR